MHPPEHPAREPFSAERLALLSRPLWWMALARAPMNFCGFDRSPIAWGVSTFIVIACLLTIGRRLRGTAWTPWMNAAVALMWIAALLRPAGFLVTIPFWPSVILGILPFAALVAAVRVCCGAAEEAQEWGASRSLRRALFACIAGWPVAMSFLIYWGTDLFGPRPSNSNAVLVCGLLLGVPYLFILHAASSMKAQPRVTSDCLKCGYSLVGLDGQVCPECGTAPKPGQASARPELRAPIPSRAIVATFVGLLPTTLAVHFVSPDNRLEKYKPLFLLEREIELGPHGFSNWVALGGIDRAETAPMREYLRRADSGMITGQDARFLADRILARYADPNAPLYLWPEVFATLDGQGLVTQVQHDRFVDEIQKVTLQLPPAVAEGDHLAFTLQIIDRLPQARPDARNARQYKTLQIPRLKAAWIDGKPIPCPDRIYSVQHGGPGSTVVSIFNPDKPLPRIPAGTGKRRLRLEFDPEMDDPKPGEDPAAGPPHVFLEGDINVTPGNPNPVGIITDAGAIEPLLSKWKWTYSVSDRGMISLKVQTPQGEPALPFSVIADVGVEFNGMRYRAGRFTLIEGSRWASIPTHHNWRPAGAPKLKLFVRPNADDAPCLPGVKSAWSGPEFTIHAERKDQPDATDR